MLAAPEMYKHIYIYIYVHSKYFDFMYVLIFSSKLRMDDTGLPGDLPCSLGLDRTLGNYTSSMHSRVTNPKASAKVSQVSKLKVTLGLNCCI